MSNGDRTNYAANFAFYNISPQVNTQLVAVLQFFSLQARKLQRYTTDHNL